MAMSGGAYRDAGIEIQKPIAIHVFDDGAFAVIDDQRIAARIGRRQNLASRSIMACARGPGRGVTRCGKSGRTASLSIRISFVSCF